MVNLLFDRPLVAIDDPVLTNNMFRVVGEFDASISRLGLIGMDFDNKVRGRKLHLILGELI